MLRVLLSPSPMSLAAQSTPLRVLLSLSPMSPVALLAPSRTLLAALLAPLRTLPLVPSTLSPAVCSQHPWAEINVANKNN
jgi:hypothetical protein